MEDFMKKVFLLAAAFVSAVLLVSCSEKLPSLSGDEALEAFDDAANIFMLGNIKAINESSKVIAGDVVCGKVKERGLFDPQIAYYLDGKEQFYIKFDTFDNPKLDGGTTYGYYDKDKNFYGYMQNLIFDRDLGFVYGFYDSDLNLKNYYLKSNGDLTSDLGRYGGTIYCMDGRKVGYVSTERRGLSSKFDIDIVLGEAVSELSIMDKVAIYWVLANELSSTYKH